MYNKETLLQAFLKLKPQLIRDPLFMNSGYGNDIERLENYIKHAPNNYEDFLTKFSYSGLRIEMQENFYEDTYMYACLLLLKEVLLEDASIEYEEDLVFQKNDFFIYPEKEVFVKGNFILNEQAIGIFLGDLIVDGNFYADGFYNRLAVAGTFKAKNIFTCAEIISTTSIEAIETACFINNDYSARSPLIKSNVLLELDRTDFFLEKQTTYYINKVYNISNDVANRLTELFGPQALVIEEQKKHINRNYFIERFKL